MPRSNKKIRLSSDQKRQLSSYINNIILQHRRSGDRDNEAFLEKAKRSIVSFLKGYGVGVDQSDTIARNLLPLLLNNFRSGNIDYVDGIVDTVCDESS